jgi:hypothetical protein
MRCACRHGKKIFKDYIAIEVTTGCVRDFDSLEYAENFKESFAETMTFEIFKKVKQ